MSASGQKRENMSKEPTWQTTTTVWTLDRAVEFKLVATERQPGVDKKDAIEVCAFWTREGSVDSAAHHGSLILGSYFDRKGAVDFIANYIEGQSGALQLMIACELDKATFCKLCQVELRGVTDKNLLMRSPVSVWNGVDAEDIVLKMGSVAVLCDACYGAMKSIQVNE